MARSDELCAVAGCSEDATCGVSRCGSATGAITLRAFGRFGRMGECAVFAGWLGLPPETETCGEYVRLLLGCIVRSGSGDFSGGIGGADCAFSRF